MEESLWEIEKLFPRMFQYTPTGIALTDFEGRFIQTNQAFQDIVGYTAEELQNLSWGEFTYPDDRTENIQLFQEICTGQRTHFSREQYFFQKNGTLVWGKLSASVLCDANGLPQYVFTLLQNTSDSQQMHSDLQAAHVQREKQLTEQTIELEKTNTLLKQEIAKRQTVQEELKIQQEFLQTLINLYPNTVFAKGSYAVVTDSTTLEAMESELQRAKEQLRAVLDAMPGFVAWINSQGEYLGVNQYMADCFNLSSDDFVGKELGFLKHSPALAQFLAQFIADSALTSRHEIEAQVNGSTRNYLIAAQKYHQDSLAVLVGIDITERKLAEAKIQTSLREKEVLLQEVHHRVKNNLQVISSLLDLQSQQIEEQAMLEVFRESQNRVKSMALVHEKLYQSKDFAKINFAEYTESLTNYLFKAYDLATSNINLELKIDEVSLNIDTAIPCGLIINELVSNALKYAFPNNSLGTITVTLHSDKNEGFILTVKDNGVGLPGDWDVKSAKSLGIQLVKILTKQLKGTIELDKHIGSKFIIRFSEIHRSEV
ncbi:MAG: PAS domain S-box protein [Coleofasciculus sp. Co-bin14]|nr:PAS domain S-box protein [Coleofasciculus sp. Co-bin14]